MKFKKLLSLLLAFLLIFSPVSLFFTFASNDTDDIIGPKVSAGNSIQLYVGQTKTFIVSAYDESGLSDNIITPEDFSISAHGLFAIDPVAKVVDVSQPYTSPSNPNFTRWDVTVKGILPGKATLQVRKNVLWDIYGNGNSYSPAMHIKNGGLFTYLYHLILNESF